MSKTQAHDLDIPGAYEIVSLESSIDAVHLVENCFEIIISSLQSFNRRLFQIAHVIDQTIKRYQDPALSGTHDVNSILHCTLQTILKIVRDLASHAKAWCLFEVEEGINLLFNAFNMQRIAAKEQSELRGLEADLGLSQCSLTNKLWNSPIDAFVGHLQQLYKIVEYMIKKNLLCIEQKQSKAQTFAEKDKESILEELRSSQIDTNEELNTPNNNFYM